MSQRRSYPHGATQEEEEEEEEEDITLTE